MEVKRQSTSPLCGNLVDGLPHDCHTETRAKRARVGPRTQMNMTMRKMFSTRIYSTSCQGSPIIVSDNVWKILIENCEFIMPRKSSIGSEFFRKFTILVNSLKIPQNL